MRSNILALVVVIGLCLPGAAHAEGADKFAHASLSGALGFALTTAFKKGGGMSTLESVALGGMTALMVGFAKEMGDGKPDGSDLLANGVGVGASSVLHIAIDF